MSKQELVTTNGEPVDWESVAKKHPKLITALRCIGIELRSMMDAAVKQPKVPKHGPDNLGPRCEDVAPKARESSTTLEAVAFTVRPSSTGREHFVEVVFGQNPGKGICAELQAAEYRYSGYNKCWYGHEDKLPARYKAVAPSAQASILALPTPEVKVEPVVAPIEAARADNYSQNNSPALFVRRTLGGTMDRGFSVVHAGSNKAIGSAYTNLSEEEANRLLAIVLPMADWNTPVKELLKVPGLQDKLGRAVCPTAPVVEPEVIVLSAKPTTPDKGKPEPGKEYALTGAKGTPAISNGNTWKESEVKPEDQAKPNHAARLRALCKKS